MDFSYLLELSVSSGTAIALLKIIAIDIILSGDNAVVIAMATKSLPKQQQNKAIFFGTMGAVVLRVLFAAVIIYLLKIPFVHFIGGLLLLWIAYNVLVEDEEDANIKSHNGLMKAITTIVIADAVMSLDNVVAITGAAHGRMDMIAIGVLISIPIMIFGSKLIVRALEKHRWIAYVGSGILAWTAGEMIVTDNELMRLLHVSEDASTTVFMGFVTFAVLILGFVSNNKGSNRKRV